MKKGWIIFLFCVLVLLILAFLLGPTILQNYFYNDQDLLTHHAPEASDVTLDVLLKPPYVSWEGWGFHWRETQLSWGEKHMETPKDADEGKAILQEVQDILGKYHFSPLLAPDGTKNYDEWARAQIKGDLPMRLSLCGDPTGQYTKTDGDVLLEWVRVILDGNGRCILTVQYSHHPRAEADVYLYVSQDPALISALEAFAAAHTA